MESPDTFSSTLTEYSKADKQIRNEVCRALKADKRVASYDLRVGVLNEVIHLAGELPSTDLWELVGEIASEIPHVRGVVNRIEAPGAPEPARTIHLHLIPKEGSRETSHQEMSELFPGGPGVWRDRE